MRPAAKHRRVGVGEGKRWQLVGVMREKFDDDIASDRAVRQVIREQLFHQGFQIEFNLDRIMDSLQDFRAWLDDFPADKILSHDRLYQKVKRELEKETVGTKITVRGPLKIGVMRKLGE